MVILYTLLKKFLRTKTPNSFSFLAIKRNKEGGDIKYKICGDIIIQKNRGTETRFLPKD